MTARFWSAVPLLLCVLLPGAVMTVEEQSMVLSRDKQLAADLSVLTALQQADDEARSKVRKGLRGLARSYMHEQSRISHTEDVKEQNLRDLVAKHMTVGEQGVVFSASGMSWVIRGAGFPTTSIIAFNRFLQQRGTDLILVPVPNHAMVYGHLLADGLDPQRDYFPDYSRGLQELLQAGVEVIDLRADFRASATTTLTRQEQFWAPAGMEIAARLVAKRLRRYDVVRTAATQHDQFSSTRGLQLSYKKVGEMAARKGLALDCRIVAYAGADTKRWNLIRSLGWHQAGQVNLAHLHNPQVYGPVTILGDEQGGYLCNHNAGFPNLLSAELGQVICHASRGAGHGFRMHVDYVDMLRVLESEPKVVVVVVSANRLRHFSYLDADQVVTKLGADEALPTVNGRAKVLSFQGPPASQKGKTPTERLGCIKVRFQSGKLLNREALVLVDTRSSHHGFKTVPNEYLQLELSAWKEGSVAAALGPIPNSFAKGTIAKYVAQSVRKLKK